jgi:divalent metal cation (Fe/Co/Zn/Cd) transporter
MPPGVTGAVFEEGRREKQVVALSSVAAASMRGLRAHGLRLHDSGNSLSLELHVEVPRALSLGEAHRLVTGFEAAVMSQAPEAIAEE